jgi:hypothetical protein
VQQGKRLLAFVKETRNVIKEWGGKDVDTIGESVKAEMKGKVDAGGGNNTNIKSRKETAQIEEEVVGSRGSEESEAEVGDNDNNKDSNSDINKSGQNDNKTSASPTSAFPLAESTARTSMASTTSMSMTTSRGKKTLSPPKKNFFASLARKMYQDIKVSQSRSDELNEDLEEMRAGTRPLEFAEGANAKGHYGGDFKKSWSKKEDKMWKRINQVG